MYKIIIIILLFLLVSNMIIFFYTRKYNEIKTIEPYLSSYYNEKYESIVTDPSLQIMVTNSFNDPSYQKIINNSGLEIYDIYKQYSPPSNMDLRTNYGTDNYNVEYHDTYDISDNSLEGSDIFKIGYYPIGSFRYGSRSFVPNYEESTLLSYYLYQERSSSV